MGKKERILELIKENDGLTYTTLIRKYNGKFEPDTLKEKSGYSYLKRLKKDGLIENDKGINVLYKPTPKAFSDKPDDFELTEYKRIIKDLIDDKNISERDYAYISRDN